MIRKICVKLYLLVIAIIAMVKITVIEFANELQMDLTKQMRQRG